jgi:hypothetical protein
MLDLIVAYWVWLISTLISAPGRWPRSTPRDVEFIVRFEFTFTPKHGSWLNGMASMMSSAKSRGSITATTSPA